MFIFAYGSIIWNPNFNYSRKFKGVLKGYKRDYSIIESHHRGNSDFPGLALGIHQDRSFDTQGVIFHINDRDWKDVYSYLQKRENSNNSYYLEEEVCIKSNFGDIKALTFVSNQESSSFCKNKCINSKAEIIKKAAGLSGHNIDYFEKNFSVLNSLNLIDEDDIHFDIKKLL